MSPSYKLEKKGVAAKTAFHSINGYKYNEVHAAVSKRLAQQKYAVEHVRALEFIRMYPSAENVELRIAHCYERNKWEQNDVKKVC